MLETLNLLNLDDAAARVGISRPLLHYHAVSGHLPYEKFYGRLFFKESAVAKFAAEYAAGIWSHKGPLPKEGRK